jgi:cysteinyl-tRNA synthetase
VLDALLDDLNTPKAVAEMHALKHAGGRKALAGNARVFRLPRAELKALAA